MFYGRMEEYSLETPVYETDAYNHTHVTYEDAGTIRAYIVPQQWTDYDSNDLKLSSQSFVGYTQNTVTKGSRIAGELIVESVTVNRMGDSVLFLKGV